MTRCKASLLSLLLGGIFVLAQSCGQRPWDEKIATENDPAQDAIKVNVHGMPEIPVEVPFPSGNPIVPKVEDVPPPIDSAGAEVPFDDAGYGGGSQGFLEPVKTGNPDHPDVNLFGQCGNGVQEVLRNLRGACPHLIYGATIESKNQSALKFFNAQTGEGFPVNNITGLMRVSAIDFSPDGTLYAVGQDTEGNSQLATLNCVTGAATPIGFTGIKTFYDDSAVITDISFDWQGLLIAHVNVGSSNFVGTLNVQTGAYTQIGNTTDTHVTGHGIAILPFATNSLFHADGVDLSQINQTTGAAFATTSLIFPGILTDPRIIALDYDPLTQILYAMVQEDSLPSYYLVKLDIATSTVTFIGEIPVTAPVGTHGVAINRRTEECDTGTQTAECINCELHETNCADGLDNDSDLLTDCSDDDCRGKTCNDMNICTLDDICVPDSEGPGLHCAGPPRNCNDFEPCTLDTCNPLATVPDPCVHTNDTNKQTFGSCERDGRACTVGRCAFDPQGESPTFTCHEENRALVERNDGPEEEQVGCNDGNECTADECVESWIKEGLPANGNVDLAAVPWGSKATLDAIGNVVVDNDWQCAWGVLEQIDCYNETTCRAGICTLFGSGISPADEFRVECLSEAVACTTSDDCPSQQSCSNGFCVDTLCPNLDNNSCTSQVCDLENGGCVTNFVNEGDSCIPSDHCLTNATCQSGVCTSATQTDCTDGNECTDHTCDAAGACITLLKANGTPVGGSCEAGGLGECAAGTLKCQSGQPTCENVKQPASETCDNGLDDNCNGLTDCSEPLCQGSEFCEICENNPEPATEICDNGLDDDCNGQIDCAQFSCQSLSFCKVRTVFLTQANVAGNFGGITAANTICQNEANSVPALMGKVFIAWLSDGTQSPSTTFVKSLAAYKLPDGTLVANNYQDLIDDTLASPINQYADMSAQEGGLLVWTGTFPPGIPDIHCNAWSSNLLTQRGTVGRSDRQNTEWTRAGAATCNSSRNFYCFEK